MGQLKNYRSMWDSVRSSSHPPHASHRQLVGRIRELAAGWRDESDAALAETCEKLRATVRAGSSVLELPVVAPAMALTFESIRRTLGFCYYDVQLLAGLALSTGAIVELKTGEGKTIVAALPGVLHALAGQGVHVATVNAYLAERDFRLLQPVFQRLGLSVALLNSDDATENKRTAYQADLTYGTGYEFGFDYLRDQSARRQQPRPELGQRFRERLRNAAEPDRIGMQREHAFAVIDEVDSVLIDEANTPLVLAGVASDGRSTTEPYQLALQLARQLQDGVHYVTDRRKRTIGLTESGRDLIFAAQHAVPSLGLARPWVTYVEQSLRADLLLNRDVDYVVRDDQVLIVDKYTGRIFPDRNWRDGLHQAVECKEKVTISAEQSSLARISRQRYFGFYRQLCGMTGTAQGHEGEFREFYRLPVVVVPERLPCQRICLPTHYFATWQAKWQAIAVDVQRRQQQGQPVLVGSATILESRQIAERLEQLGVPFQLLNGTQDEEESAIVATAGQVGSVVIATNMAGRGTDIKVDPQAIEAGGLHVISTQRQESLRVDRQLMGRSGRQGQPGSFQTYVSAEDELLTQHAPQLAERIVAVCSEGDTGADRFNREVDKAQQIAEEKRYEARCDLFRQDAWLNEVLSKVAETDQPQLQST